MNELESEPGPLPHPARLEAVMGPVVLVREDTPLRDVATLMLESHVDCMVVVDAAGVARGIVTDRQLTLDERWLRLSAVKVPHLHGRGGLEASGVALVNARFRDGPGYAGSATFVVKRLDGPARREREREGDRR